MNNKRTCRCTIGYQTDGEKGCKPYDKFAIVSQLEMMRGYSLDDTGEAMTPVSGTGVDDVIQSFKRCLPV